MWIRRTVRHRRIVHWLWGQVGLQQLTTVRDHPTLNTLFGCAPIDSAEYQEAPQRCITDIRQNSLLKRFAGRRTVIGAINVMDRSLERSGRTGLSEEDISPHVYLALRGKEEAMEVARDFWKKVGLSGRYGGITEFGDGSTSHLPSLQSAHFVAERIKSLAPCPIFREGWHACRTTRNSDYQVSAAYHRALSLRGGEELRRRWCGG